MNKTKLVVLDNVTEQVHVFTYDENTCTAEEFLFENEEMEEYNFSDSNIQWMTTTEKLSINIH